MTGQADMMQARWGSHGDYELIALAPSSPQDCFYQTIRAFNLSEKYRVPVLVMADEIVGHMSEKVIIPDASKIKLVSRPKPTGRKDRFKLYEPGPNGVAPMPAIGDGYNIHVTGLTHDERGYPAMNVEAQEQMLSRLKNKIQGNLDDIVETESYRMEDADIVIVSYGISVRTGLSAVDRAREMGYKAGLLRLITVWPFPEAMIRDIAARVKGLITVEINLGQIHYEVERCAGGQAKALLVGSAGGKIIHPDKVLECIQKEF
jgi:2-oxoglutarate ferredoxin oxidoreductase subunit alpha